MTRAAITIDYRAPAWLVGGHLQTIVPALQARRRPVASPGWRRERWNTPDGDFIDVDWLNDDQVSLQPEPQQTDDARKTPLLVLFHGLEGSSASHYAVAFGRYARQRGWAYAVPHFRGCSGELNRLPRAYHSGDFAEIGWVLECVRARHRAGPLFAVGVSLGGNALMLWAGREGAAAARSVDAIASVCAPLDLAAAGAAIGRGFGRHSYTPMFLRSMKPKALAKLAQHPGLFDAGALRATRTLHEFDDVFTAPLHGFRDADDYWQRASAAPQLHRIRVPALALNSLNDPFVPAASLPGSDEVGDCVTLWRPAHGGHVGFAQGLWARDVQALPDAVGGWFAQHLRA